MANITGIGKHDNFVANLWKTQSVPAKKQPAPPPASWTFLTNHAHVLVCIAQNPDIRISEIADLVGIGERAAHRIVGDLVGERYVTRKKDGRRNTYSVDFSRNLRHPLESSHTIGEVFKILARMRSAR